MGIKYKDDDTQRAFIWAVYMIRWPGFGPTKYFIGYYSETCL